MNLKTYFTRLKNIFRKIRNEKSTVRPQSSLTIDFSFLQIIYPMSTGTPHNFIDLSYLELMSDGDHDMKKTMLEMLLEELPEEIQKMSELTAAQDWEELSNVSHKMKSTLSFVGYEAMTEMNKELELLSNHAGNPKRIIALMGQLEKKTAEVMPEIQAEFEA
ncbi:MAG: HPt (histidine-containing phosphotransfer) domain-containing protein [Paraglaciecola sp.]